MTVIDTSTLRQGEVLLANEQIYNGLDCCVTVEVQEELTKLEPDPPLIYSFERALQGPALEMMLRGVRVDEYERQKGIGRLEAEIVQIDNILQEFAHAVWGKGLNERSTKQLIAFFYGAMKLPEVVSYKKGVRKISMDREALEKIDNYFHARPIVACILEIRDRKKQLEFLSTVVDSDGRLRTSYNIAGTETWRFSSSTNAFGTGGNIQNWKRDDEAELQSGALSLRRIVAADSGRKLYGFDLEQTESRDVGILTGLLFDDWRYLDACESGDLHTEVARFAWPDLSWSGDRKKDRALADQRFYRNYSYRDMAKKLGHGSNYYGQPYTMAKHAKIPVPMVEAFQRRYFDAYPAIPRWHRKVAEELQTTQTITNIWGVVRHFFGRPNDDTTLREAIAHGPQSATGIRTNLGLWRIWRHMPEVQVLMQLHDAVYFQASEELDEAALIAKATKLIEVPLVIKGRKFVVPCEAKTGWNWGSYDPAYNPDGLKKFKGVDSRRRANATGRLL